MLALHTKLGITTLFTSHASGLLFLASLCIIVTMTNCIFPSTPDPGDDTEALIGCYSNRKSLDSEEVRSSEEMRSHAGSPTPAAEF